jgi:hypothetical protein
MFPLLGAMSAIATQHPLALPFIYKTRYLLSDGHLPDDSSHHVDVLPWNDYVSTISEAKSGSKRVWQTGNKGVGVALDGVRVHEPASARFG